MLRNVLAALAGFIVALLVIAGVQYISSILFPMPEGIDLQSAEEIRQWVETLPIAALFLVLLSYALGSFLGGMAIGIIAKNKAVAIAIGVGILLTLAGISNLLVIPHPLWFTVINLVLYVPLTIFGAKTAVRNWEWVDLEVPSEEETESEQADLEAD